MGEGGFEPPKPKQQIYSLPHLTALELSLFSVARCQLIALKQPDPKQNLVGSAVGFSAALFQLRAFSVARCQLVDLYQLSPK